MHTLLSVYLIYIIHLCIDYSTNHPSTRYKCPLVDNPLLPGYFAANPNHNPT